MRLSLGLALVSLLLLPGVAAQSPPPGGYKPMLVEIGEPDGLLDPRTDVAAVNLTVRLDCILAQSDTPMNFTVTEKPDWLYIRSMPGWFTPFNNYTGYGNLPCDQSSGYVTIEETMVANFTTYAPAYRFANFTVKVTRSNSVVTAFGSLQPGYFGELEVVPPKNVVRVDASDDKVDVPFRIRNLGNGETVVKLTYDHPEDVRIDAPDVLKLGASQQGGDWNRELVVKVYLTNVVDDFTITVKATGFSSNQTDPQPAAGHEATATVDFLRQVPAPSAALVLAAVAALGLLLRRKASR